MADPDHVIMIRDGEYGGFYVEVVPPPLAVGHDCELASKVAAVGYARRLQKAMGWRVLDLADE